MPPAPHPLLARALSLASDGRIGEGLEILERLAAEGEPEASFLLAETYWAGRPVRKDPARARALFEQASAAGHPQASIHHTNLLANGVAGPRDWPGALARLGAEARLDAERATMFGLVEAMDLDAAGDPAHVAEGERLSESPLVTLFRGAVSPAECAFLLGTAAADYRPALVADATGAYVRDPVRTSEEVTIHWLIEDPATHALNRRIAALGGSEADRGEPLQILRYRPGQQYRPHVDWDGGDNRRIATALIYLNHDYAGGETHFVKTGLKVKGRMGDVLVFRSADDRGDLDPMAEHAGLPVTEGTKFIASRWIHERRYDG